MVGIHSVYLPNGVCMNKLLAVLVVLFMSVVLYAKHNEERLLTKACIQGNEVACYHLDWYKVQHKGN